MLCSGPDLTCGLQWGGRRAVLPASPISDAFRVCTALSGIQSFCGSTPSQPREARTWGHPPVQMGWLLCVPGLCPSSSEQLQQGGGCGCTRMVLGCCVSLLACKAPSVPPGQLILGIAWEEGTQQVCLSRMSLPAWVHDACSGHLAGSLLTFRREGSIFMPL